MGMGLLSRSTASAKRSNPLPKDAGRSKGRFTSIRQGRVTKDASCIDEAVKYLIQRLDPSKIIVYGPSASGFIDSSQLVEMMVVMDHGNPGKVGEEADFGLMDDLGIYARVTVVSPSEFERKSSIRGSSVEYAVRTGYVAYES